MDKKWAVLLLILIIILPIAYSLSTITLEETELVALKPAFEDPDGDKLEYSYTYPLNDEGEWQTDYGDEGEYIVTVTASDGQFITEEEVIIVVNKKEEPPEIDEFFPDEALVSVKEGKFLHFEAAASDINEDELTYEWFFDDESLGFGQKLEYFADYFDEGEHIIKVIVSDGALETIQEWTVDIEDFDRGTLLDGITDIEVDETESVYLELPDFEAYDLEYEISEPIGNDNLWETTYDDAGEYLVTIKIMDRDFEYSKRIDVAVNNIDRPPTIDPIANRVVSEGEEVVITLSGNDPDEEEITFSAVNAPEDSTFEDNIFRWTPHRDFVKKTNFFTKLLDKFHMLRKTQKVRFIAKSNEFSITKKVKIKVLDDNRAPVIEDKGPIIVNELETVHLEPNIYDLDNDRISWKYSGWMDKPIRETGYEDAGNYTVTLTASDGKCTIAKNLVIIVKNVNRAPTLDEIPKHDVNEGEALSFGITSYDPDYDEITISVEDPPSGSSLDEDVFRWMPDYEETKKHEAKQYTLTFTGSDGDLTASEDAVIVVHNTNRPPKVLNLTPNMGRFSVYANSPVLFQIFANDPDGDELSYEWSFSRRDKFKGSPAHKRTFTVPGQKEVTVIISDGDYSLKVKWYIDVLEPPKQETLEPVVITSPAAQTQQTQQQTQTQQQVQQPTQTSTTSTTYQTYSV